MSKRKRKDRGQRKAQAKVQLAQNKSESPANEKTVAPIDLSTKPIRWRQVLSTVLEVLGLIGIAVGIVSFFDVRRVEHKIDDMTRIQEFLAEKQRPVREELARSSAEYIGAWPGLLPQVTELFSRTEGELDIMTGPLGFGMFSSPDEFRAYMENIKASLTRGTKVRILINDPSVERQQIRNQFLLVSFDELRQRPEFERFFHFYRDPRSSTYDEFVSALLNREREYADELLHYTGVEIRYSTTAITSFFWVRDNREAIVSFQSANANSRQDAFRTRDPRLLQIFQNQFQEAWKKSRVAAAT